MYIPALLFKFVSLLLGLHTGGSFPPPLSQAEEAELFARMKAGDREARGRLIEHNLRLVSHIIRKYYTSYPNPDEMISIGSLGLMKGVDSFRAELGTRFATYGARCIQNEILMFFRSQKKTLGEISIHETIDVDRDGNPLTYLDIISVDDTMAEDIELRGYAERLLQLVDERLDERERRIIVLRYGLQGYTPKTQREVARYLGISRSYVSRIEKKALCKLKDAFGPCVPDLSS